MPLDVLPHTSTWQIVTECGTVLVSRHQETYNALFLDIYHDPLNCCDDFITRERIHPRMEDRVPYPRFHEVHLPHILLILQKSSQLLRIWRPHDDWTIASTPTCIVSGIGKVFDPVEGHLCFFTCFLIPHPNVVIVKICSKTAVWGYGIISRSFV